MSESAGGTTDREPTAPITESPATAATAWHRARSLFLPGIVLAGCLATAACTTDEQAQIDPKLGVAPSPRVVGSTDPVPPGGGRYMTGKPYRVGGRLFEPMDNPKTDYEVIGIASWYGSNFHGRRTANGEVFDSKSLSAAHPTLPLPSYIRVTNLANGRSIVLRVNDRGPFHGRRVIDVSGLAADKLDFKRKGMARVRVQYVGPAQLDGLDHEKLLASYREPGQPLGPAPGTPVPEARNVLIASAETRTEERRVAAPVKQNRGMEIMLARGRRDSSPVAVLQSSRKAARPAAAAPASQPVEAARSFELAAAPAPQAAPAGQAVPTGTAGPLPGVETALATAVDPATADPGLAATMDLAMASTAGFVLPRPRPGDATAAPTIASEIAAAPAAVPATGYATAPSVADAAPEMQVAAVSFAAPMPSRKPSLPTAAAYPPGVPAAEPTLPVVVPVAAPTPAARPSSIDDLLAPPSGAPAATFAPMTLSPAPSYAPAAPASGLEAALARYVAGTGDAGRQ